MTDRATTEQLEQLRMTAADLFRRLPEVPVYRRRDDPTRTLAAERAVEARALLHRTESLRGAEALTSALRAHLLVLDLLADGRVEAAEGVWHEAMALERAAVSSRRLWSRSDEVSTPVYARDSGSSRFDPRPETAIKVKLACPHPSCHKVADYDFSARLATHPFECQHCKQGFFAYFAELHSLNVESKGKTQHRYRFEVRELNGTTTRLDFDDASPAVLVAARGDLIAFLYAPKSRLRGVLDLTSSRVLWVKPTGPCFLATAAFGEDAAELDAFRHFRDEALLPSAAGRLFVRAYYAVGPSLAAIVVARPALHRITRAALSALHRVLP